MRVLRLVLTIVVAIPGIKLAELSGGIVKEYAEVFEDCMSITAPQSQVESGCIDHMYDNVATPLIIVWVTTLLYAVYLYLARQSTTKQDHATFGKTYENEGVADFIYEFATTVALIVAVALSHHDLDEPSVTFKAGFWLLVTAMVISIVTSGMYLMAHMGKDTIFAGNIYTASGPRTYLHPPANIQMQENCSTTPNALAPGKREWGMRV